MLQGCESEGVDVTPFLPVLYAEGADLNPWQMSLRAVIIYMTTLIIVRLGNKRLFGKNTAMDIVLGVILGSVMSRAINGGVAMLPTLCAGGALVVLHYLSARIAVAAEWFGPLLKGHPRQLVKEGKVQEVAMRRSVIGYRDLEEAARSEGKVRGIGEIEEAWLERSGNISVITPKREPRVIEIAVKDGVQAIRLEVS